MTDWKLQFNCTVDMFVPDVAASFQRFNVTALVYDPRSIGLSDGHPRNDIDPVKQVEDYSDALTFLSKLAMVDPDQIVFWGFSFGGTVSLCAASLDKRAKAIVAVCPMTKFEHDAEKLPKVLAKAMQDRVSQTHGNPPFYIPMLTEDGENPAGFGVGIDKDNYGLLVDAKQKIAPTFENRTTIQTYYKLMMWQPNNLWSHLSPTPVLFVIPELDTLCPRDEQLHQFAKLLEPKVCHIESGKGHMDVLSGDSFPKLMKLQVDFILRVLAGEIGSPSA